MKDRSQDEWRELLNAKKRDIQELESRVSNLETTTQQLRRYEQEVIASRQTISVLKEIIIELKTERVKL